MKENDLKKSIGATVANGSNSLDRRTTAKGKTAGHVAGFFFALAVVAVAVAVVVVVVVVVVVDVVASRFVSISSGTERRPTTDDFPSFGSVFKRKKKSNGFLFFPSFTFRCWK